MDHVAVIDAVVLVLELAAVAILAVGTLWALGRMGVQRLRGAGWETVIDETRERVGRTLLLGLEVLIAADVILTVSLDLTFQSVGALGLIVVIRTFLSWTIEVESEGHWPWKRAEMRARAAEATEER